MTTRPNMRASAMEGFDGTNAYIELLKLCLNGLLTPSPFFVVPGGPDEIEVVPLTLETMEKNMRSHRSISANGFTMIGLQRSENLQACVEDVLANDVPGDMIETGVWRGGATILMRALLKVNGVTDRNVVVADSFQGVPPPDPGRYPADVGSQLFTWERLAVSVDIVKEHFARFGMLDEQVYPNLSPGGYLIVDDYGALRKCRAAVHDYRDAHGIEEEIHEVDWSGVYWRKQA